MNRVKEYIKFFNKGDPKDLLSIVLEPLFTIFRADQLLKDFISSK